MTSYGDKWLGYAEFEPVWEELNRRKATVYTHPTTANCCVNLVRGIDDAYIEFGTDTTRSIFSLIFSGSSQKNKDINWIWSHGGGALTAFAEPIPRPSDQPTPLCRQGYSRHRDGELKRFYYDTAQVANNVTLAAMAQLMPISQIVYGTDFPYRTAADDTKGVTEFFKGDDLKAVDRENVIRLIPRLKAI
jgi:6-methylsalicylate decarboxylase